MKFRIRKNSAQSAAQSPAPGPDIRLGSWIGSAAFAFLLGLIGSWVVDAPAGEAVVGSYRGTLLAGGNLKVRAENILLRTVAARALGNYDIDVALRDTAAEFRITQASGPLKLDGGGSIKWSLPHQLSYRGIAGAPADAAEVLAPLRLIGRPMADGRVQIDYQGGW